MPRVGLTIRLFIGLLLGAVPILVVLAITLRSVPAGLPFVDAAIVAGSLMLMALGWLAAVAVYQGHALGREVGSLANLAERGVESSADDAPTAGDRDGLYRRVALSLEERNRQITELAAQVSSVPIGGEPREVAEHVVAAAREVTRDPTWSLAVLDSAARGLMPVGVYDDGSGSIGTLSDLHRWAAVSAGEASERLSPVHVDGPWGAFMVATVAADDELRAVLLAPWEGRSRPVRAETALLHLVAQHAATAIQYALLYARFREQAAHLDEMGEIQRDFLRAVSHDLQTPLTSIRAIAHELATRSDLHRAARADLDLIGHQADRLRRMVAQLLAVSRLEAGSIQPRQEVFHPRPLLERTWKALRATDRALRITDDGSSMLVVADPDRLEQVLWALLDNAVKYSPPASDIDVAMRSDAPRTFTIAITDHGAGMDPDTRRRAFEQFYRGSGARTLAPDGSGVGLYAARGLVEAMEGRIDLTSGLGRGTTILVRLPAEPAGSADDDAAGEAVR